MDECDGACGSVDGVADGAAVTSSTDGDVATVQGGKFCTAPLTPGRQTLTVAGASATVDVAGFGYDVGFERPETTVDSVPWTPSVDGITDPPLLGPTADAWDAAGVESASYAEFGGLDLLYYGGTDDEFFHLGEAVRTSPDHAFVKTKESPVLSPGDPGANPGRFDDYGQTTPEAVVVGDELWLYYTGQGSATGDLSIGLATSTDGLAFTPSPDNPVLSPTGDGADFDGKGVAHPSVEVHDGVWELWYATGTTMEIGYALSTDGTHFARYCKNPVFVGPGTWDRGRVKAPEVHYDGDRYFMTWSGCDKGCYQVGWAASGDGLRWVAAPDPLIPAQGGDAWNGVATREASIFVSGDAWSFWYTGNDGRHERIGVVTATGP